MRSILLTLEYFFTQISEVDIKNGSISWPDEHISKFKEIHEIFNKKIISKGYDPCVFNILGVENPIC
jgi:hypothetical protein